MFKLFDILTAYRKTRGLRFANREALEQYQQKQLQQMQHRLTRRSPYFAPFKGKPLSEWPLMDKALMMQHFDAMNTAGLRLPEVLQSALDAEKSRAFSPTVNGFTVGLSSGTSGARGVFVVGAREKNRWAGIMLAKALPRGLFAGERVALFLRANSNLYTAVRSPFLQFEFFDLLAPWEEHLSRLHRYRPTVIVAPAQVLRRLAKEQERGKVDIEPTRLLSAAEVLEQQDRELITRAFGPVLGEIYQATEGFLGITCAHGRLHLNEEFLHVEPEWLDAEHRRFIPIVTDFSRETQPVVRYRLNDILVASGRTCTCGSPTRVIDAIEGRCDDMLRLPSPPGNEPGFVEIFADATSRALLQVLPLAADYRLTQTGRTSLVLQAALTEKEQKEAIEAMNRFFEAQGADMAGVVWSLKTTAPENDFSKKRRRIVREWQG